MGKLWDVEPAEDLQKVGQGNDKVVANTWTNVNVHPAMVTEADRNTGEISSSASASLRSAADNQKQ